MCSYLSIGLALAAIIGGIAIALVAGALIWLVWADRP